MTKFKSPNVFASFSNAIHGLKLVFFSQRNFVIELVIALLVFIFAVFLKFSCTDMAILLVMIVLVLLAELLNSIIEFTLDAVYKNKYSQLVKMAKDISSGMVLLVAFFSILVGLLLFIPYIINNFFK